MERVLTGSAETIRALRGTPQAMELALAASTALHNGTAAKAELDPDNCLSGQAAFAAMVALRHVLDLTCRRR